MSNPATQSIDELRVRAKAGDKQALQTLRDLGFFDQKQKERQAFVLSPAQKRLWVIDQMLPGTAAYNVAGALLFEGPLDIPAFEGALIEIVRRHESLRTSFFSVNGQPRQKVDETAVFALNHVDLRGHEKPIEVARDLARSHAAEPFNLETGPLFRATLLHLEGPNPGATRDLQDSARYVFLYCLHHIICDEWSLGVLVGELGTLYRAFVRDQPSPLQPISLQYKDFAARQHQQLQSPETDLHRRYWNQKLSDELVPLDVVPDFHRPAVQSFAGDSQLARIDAGTSLALRQLSQTQGTSLYVTLLSLVKALFHRYTDQEEITIGCPVAGRERYDLENQIGFFVNTLALRDSVLPSDTFSQLIDKVRQTVAGGFEHQSYPLENILDDLKLNRDPSHAPLFNAMVVLSDDTQQPVDLEGVVTSDFDTDYVQARFDFVFGFTDSKDGININLIYNRDLYSKERIGCMVRHLQNLARTVIKNTGTALDRLDVTDAEERRLLSSFNPPPVAYPAGQTIHQLFESWVQKAPHRPALITALEVTYRDLDAKANRWARALRSCWDVKAEVPVGVLLRDRQLIVPALLAILKAGGAYVPIDPSLPFERIQYILDDSGCRVVLTDFESARPSAVPVVTPASLDRENDASSLQSVVSSRSLAYIIYTSGSTGRPKGVMVEHEGFVNMIYSQIAAFSVDPDDRVLQFASCAFDASLYEIFLALHAGASLVTVPEGVAGDPARLLERIAESQVTVAVMPPSYLRLLGLDRLQGLKTLVTAGEQAIHENGAFARQGRHYINAYGPTEFSVCATTYNVPPGFPSNRTLPIGRPNPNVEILILETRGDRIQPLGVVGELCLAGINLARGYVNLPELTAESFPPHPYRDGERIYRTGDLARWLPDGTIEFLGRRDDQVKIDGYRIELDEIENQLSQHRDVVESGVTVRQRDSKNRAVSEIIAYVVVSADSGSATSHLRDFLARRVPGYMLPAHIVKVDALPRTISGKLDRGRLPDPTTDTSLRSGSYVQPEGELEEQLGAIWQDILGVERVGVEDEFFQLGGNSLKAIALAGRIRTELQVGLDIREVFQAPTIRQLAEVLNGRSRQIEHVIAPTPDAEHYAVSNAQRRLWVIDRMDVNRSAYNIASITRLRGPLSVDALEQSLAHLIKRHESLRTRFVEIDDEPRQVIDEIVQGFFHCEDLRDANAPVDEAEKRAVAETARPFELTLAPLFRATLFQAAHDDHFLVFNMHHIISDGWSLEVLIGELLELYVSRVEKNIPTLTPLRIQYRDYARWENDRIVDEGANADKHYWLDQLGEDIPILDLPTDTARPAVQSFRGAAMQVNLAHDVSSAIRELARESKASLFAVCTSIVKILLHRYTGSEDILVGAPVAGRNHPDLEGQVGFFVNMLALRDPMVGTDSVADVLHQVKSTIEAALDHSAYPFDLLVEELDLDRDMGRNPLFDVVVSYLDAPTGKAQIPGLQVEEIPFQPGISKFDLTFFFAENENGSIGLAIEYATDLFRPERIERMAAHLQVLASSMVHDFTAGIGTLSLMDPDETARLLSDYSGRSTVYPRDATVVGLFEAQATRIPDRPAVVSDTDELTYKQLNTLANGLAATIRARVDLREEEPVGILLNRSVWAAVGALAILKTGGAYLPLDAAYPADRLAFILEETGCRLVLTDSQSVDVLRTACPNLDVIDLASLDLDRDVSVPNPAPAGTPNSLAYIVYTSGSTGRPKGVQIEQRSVIRLVRNTDYVELDETVRILQTGSLAFDASTFEIWGALLNGGCVCFPREEILLEPSLLKKAIRDLEVTTLFMTTGLFNQTVDADPTVFEDLSQLLTGGEKVSTKHINRVRESHPELKLIHCYGPTENTTFTTCHPVDHTYEDDVPLGRPIANTTVYVLDNNLRLCPVGLPGEICTGGDGVARGYLARPDLTRDSFVPNPFVDGDTLYRTGDIGFWNNDGMLSFLGRVDDQVKIRGFRVEPGDVEHHLRDHPDVNGACVLARRTTVDTYELIGYYTSTAEVDRSSLRSFLETRLPVYTIPSHFVHLSRFPVNRNGKIDHNALPDVQAAAGQDYLAPVTVAECAISDVISTVLGIPRIGLYDNFLELGGDSIRAIQVVSRLKQQMLSIQVKDLFQAENIKNLAERVKSADTGPPPEHFTGLVPLTPVQTWFFRHHEHGLHHFNQSILLKTDEPIDETGIRSVFEQLFHHHDMLRATFTKTPDGWAQEVGEHSEVCIEHIDLRETSEPASALESHAAGIQGSFDLSEGPLAKAVIYRMPDGDRLFVVIHHLLVDGVSWRILLEDLETGYGQYLRESEIEFAGRTDTFLAWSKSLRRFGESEEMKQEMRNWIEDDRTATTDLPLDFDPSGVNNLYRETETVGVSLSEEETKAFLSHPQRVYRADADTVLLSALSGALGRWHGGSRTRILIESHGREPFDGNQDLTRTVGWFTSMYPFVLRASDAGPRQTIRRTKEDLRRIPRHGLTYGVSTYLSDSPPTLSSHPTLVYNYLGQFDAPSAGEANQAPLFAFAEESQGPVFGARVRRQADLELTGIVSSEKLQLSLTYHPGLHRKGTVTSLLEDYRREVLALIDHCQTTTIVEKTPTDFTTCDLSVDEYDMFLASTVWHPDEIDDVYPLSPMQAGLLYQDALESDATAYHLQMSFTLRGDLDIGFFQSAWNDVIDRHAILRTAFVQDGPDEPLQVVLKNRPGEFHVEDISSSTREEQERHIADFRARDLARGFNLESDPLVRFAVFHLSAAHDQVVWSYHHIILDGWSLGNLYAEFGCFYDARISGSTAHLPSVQPFGRYIKWLQDFDSEQARSFWKERLQNVEQITSIPILPSSKAEQVSRADEVTLQLTEEETQAVSALARKTGVTVSTLLQATWAILLSRYNNTTDTVFGTVVSGRPSELSRIEEMVGLFINAIPQRIVIVEEQPFTEFVRTVQKQVVEAEPYHFFPLAEMHALTPFHQGIFDHLFTFENYPTDRVLSESEHDNNRELTVENLTSHDKTHYPFELVVVPGEKIEFRLAYNSHVYSEEQIIQVREHLRTTLTRIVADPDTPVGKIDILPIEEQSRLDLFHGTISEKPPGNTVLQLIDKCVRANPESIALVWNDEQITYDGLDRRTNQLANYLISRFGIGSDDHVAIVLDRSERTVTSALAILKSGASFLPIDADCPRERVAFLLTDSAARVVLTESRHADRLPESDDTRVVYLDLVEDDIRDLDSGDLDHRPVGRDAAYVIYTSGSTGKPKGCVVEHRNLVNYLTWASDTYFESPDAGHFGLHATLAFDATLTSVFLPLIRGNTLTIYSEHIELRDIFEHMLSPKSPVNSIKLTPSHISLLRDFSLPVETNVHTVIVGGEPLLPDRVALLHGLNPAVRIFNEYGPTETTVGCIVTRILPGALHVPIGRPIANTRIYVLDSHKRMVPIGSPGEIYIAGAGVSRGYLNRADLNSERFVDIPLCGNERIYRSGDLGRWLPDGNVEYLGRVDDQVKIRGHRIEPAEVEAALLNHVQVIQTAVLATGTGAQDETELTAYVVGPSSTDDLRSWLLQRLPDYMVPTWFVLLDELPLTVRGKLDRGALLDPMSSSAGASTGVTEALPGNPLETRILDIWISVLKVDYLGIHDDFFDLGGHSLKATQILSRVFRDMDIKVSLKDFFKYSTVAELAEHVRHIDARNEGRGTEAKSAEHVVPIDAKDGAGAIRPAPHQDTYALSHAQKRLWLLHQLGDAVSHNVPQAFLISGNLDKDTLRIALAEIVDRHEILRTVFVEVDGEPRQRILPNISFDIEQIDLSGGEDPDGDARHLVQQEALLPFDLAKPPLFRGKLLRLAERRNVLLINMHHIVGDGWSDTILFREMVELYDAHCMGKPDPLLPLRIQYRDFSEWQNRNDFEQEEAYWLTRLAGLPDEIRLPFDFQPGEERAFEAAVETIHLDGEVLDALRTIAQAKETTLANLLLTLFKLFLFRLTKQEDLCVGVNVASRNHADLENLIGFFVNLLPIRTRLSSDMSFDTLFESVSKTAVEAYDHQDYPFDLMVQKLNPTRTAGGLPLVNVLFAFQNFVDVHVEVSMNGASSVGDTDLRIEAFPFSFKTSKFDLTLLAIDDADRLDLHVEYDAALFRCETIQSYLATLVQFASTVARSHPSAQGIMTRPNPVTTQKPDGTVR